jgi:hypothetical protein
MMTTTVPVGRLRYDYHAMMTTTAPVGRLRYDYHTMMTTYVICSTETLCVAIYGSRIFIVLQELWLSSLHGSRI